MKSLDKCTVDNNLDSDSDPVFNPDKKIKPDPGKLIDLNPMMLDLPKN